MRMCCSPVMMIRIIENGLVSFSVKMIGCCLMASFALVFRYRSISVERLKVHDIVIADRMVSATSHRKGERRQSCTLCLFYGELDLENGGEKMVQSMKKWEASWFQSAGFFDLTLAAKVGTASLGSELCMDLDVVGEVVVLGVLYGLHSLRIGIFNELAKLCFTREWLIHLLYWATETLFQIYFDIQIVTSPDSERFYPHLRHD